jgi:hypothetical protein
MTPSIPIAPPALLVLCLGLAILLVDEIERPIKSPPLPELTASTSDSEAPRAPAAFLAPPLREFAEIAARPVFVVTRRPPPPAAPPPPTAPTAVAPPAPPVAAKAIMLLGIVGAPTHRIALLEPPNASAVQSVVEGGSIAGWQVVHILADRVVLQWNATEEEISFPKLGDKPAVAPPATARAPAPGNRRP